MKYIKDIEGYELEPMKPSETNRGGIYAKEVDDTTDMVEVVVGDDGKGYANISDLQEQIQESVNAYLEENPVSGVVTDNAFNVNSVNAIQNKVITQALTTGVMEIKGVPSLEEFEVNWENGTFGGTNGLPNGDGTNRIRTSDYIPIDTQTVVSIKENADIEFCPLYYGENYTFISSPNAYQITDLVIESGGDIKFLKLMARKKSNTNIAIDTTYSNNLSLKRLVDNATIKAFYTPNEVDEIISQVGTIDTVFDEDSANAMANNTLLEVFETGKINVLDYLETGEMNIVWENGAFNNNGSLNDGAPWRARTQDFIPINTELKITATGDWQFCPFYYDTNQNFVSSPNTYQADELVLEPSDTISYIKILAMRPSVTGGTLDISDVGIKVIMKETTVKVPTERKVFYTADEINEIAGNYWSGKTLIWTGDSIPHGQTIGGNVATPYPQIVAKNLGMTLKNYSIGGSTFAKKSNYGGAFGSKTEFDEAEKDTSLYYDVITGQTYTTYGYDADSTSWKSAGAGASRTPLSERLHLMADGDLVVYAGGTNDFQYNWTELGTMEDRDNTTFYGALHTVCLALLEKYYGKQIIFCTPIKRCQNPYTTITSKNNSNLTLKEYGEIIKEVCDYYSIPVIDLYSVSGLNPHIPSQSALFDSYKTHPLQAGHDILGGVCTSQIKSGVYSNSTSSLLETKINKTIKEAIENILGGAS